jgi:hypothetical protein
LDFASVRTAGASSDTKTINPFSFTIYILLPAADYQMIDANLLITTFCQMCAVVREAQGFADMTPTHS